MSERTRDKAQPPRVDAPLAFALSARELYLAALELSNQQLSEVIFNLCRAQGGSLRSVHSVMLFRNRIMDFPLRALLFIGQMQQITSLDLSFNNIRTVPEEISQLTCLTRLQLNSNSIKSLPRHLALIPSLTSLHAGDNLLTQLPMFLLRATALKELSLTGM